MKLNGNDIMTFAAIADALAAEENLSVETLSERVGLTPAAASDCIGRLERGGYVQVCRKNGCRSTYAIVNEPGGLQRLRGWLYRFTPREFWRRMMMAYAAERIYKKAHRVRAMDGDVGWVVLRGQLFARYPDLCDLSAVWPLDVAEDIETVLNLLLEADNETGVVETVPAEPGNDRR